MAQICAMSSTDPPAWRVFFLPGLKRNLCANFSLMRTNIDTDAHFIDKMRICSWLENQKWLESIFRLPTN